VNCDKSKDTLRQLTKQQNVTWRCWWDGRNGIGEQWQVEGYPTLDLLDEKGVIREIFNGQMRRNWTRPLRAGKTDGEGAWKRRGATLRATGPPGPPPSSRRRPRTSIK
jgi:hypothetical protein